jgi:hypothetical protein
MIPIKKYSLALFLAFTLSAGAASAQSISQLLTQLSLDIQKLTELRAILNDMYKSYTILDKGYTDIKNIAEGNFNLHKAFLDGLLAISPTVGSYYKVAGIINAQISTVTEYKSSYRQWQSDGHFTVSELNYIGGVYAGLLSRSLRNLDALSMVITAGELRMSDAERQNAIDQVYADVTGQLSALRSFNNSIAVQAAQRTQQANDINTLKLLYGLPD